MSEGSAPMEPGATLGVFGGGQLGRMFAQAAATLGYRARVFAPERDCPASQVAAEHVNAEYEDLDAVRRFARGCDAVTIEFENIPVETLEAAAEETIVRPGPGMLAVAQDRLREREFLNREGLPVSPNEAAFSEEDARRAVDRLKTPAVLKSSRFGYDGRGQVRIDRPEEVASGWERLGAEAALCEAWVEFDCEVSVIVARDANGGVETFGPVLNHHVNHILDVSVCPAPVQRRVAEEAVEFARRVAKGLSLQGVLCVEMFLSRDGGLLINELAPRPHNSGHLSIEASAVSQFEQQVRALCSLPLGRMTLRRPAAMVNLLGDLWLNGQPDWAAVLQMDEAHLHLYGKAEARRGRKMGHITALAESAEQAESAACTARHRAGSARRRDDHASETNPTD